MRRFALFALFALSASGCNAWYNAWSPDDLMKGIPWFDHMIQSRMISPYSRWDVPRYTVPGTVPITGGEPDWGKEFLGGSSATADRLVNPSKPDSATLARGDTLFHTFCSVCHGGGGAGDGLVRLGAPSLLTDRVRGFSDGFIYSMIRYGGRALMPRYGDKIYRPEDRWAVVHYVRALLGQAPAASSDSTARPPVRPPARP